MNILMDTLGFNMAFNQVYNHATAESLIARGFRVVEPDSMNHPGYPGDYAQGWHLIWQSDPGNIPAWYQGSQWRSETGRQHIDQGDTVWFASDTLESSEMSPGDMLLLYTDGVTEAEN